MKIFDWTKIDTKRLMLMSIILSGLFSIVFVKIVIFLDSDFGWHITIGEQILSKGIPYSDPFSYTMPSFPMIAHSWGSELLFAIFFPIIGYIGLAFIAGFVSFAALIIVLPRHTKTWLLIPVMFATAGILPQLNVRPQAFSWFFFALILKIILDKQLWRKYRKYIPLIMLLWVNMHGSFAAGIAMIISSVIVRTIQEKKRDNTDITIAVVSVLTTFVNPYGLRLWREVYATFFSSKIHLTIFEWLPTILKPDIFLVPVFGISLVLMVKYWKRFTLLERWFGIVFLVAGLSSRKLLPFWYIVSVPIISLALNYLHAEIANNKEGVKRFNIFISGLFLFAIIILAIQTPRVMKVYRTLSEKDFYPQQAVSYLKLYTPKNNIFAPFGWGGYLIWNLPGKKVFIDGRMPYWTHDNPPPGESADALQEYHNILAGNIDFRETIKKYSIDTLLISVDDKKYGPLVDIVLSEGWTEKYRDDIAIIYRKN